MRAATRMLRHACAAALLGALAWPAAHAAGASAPTPRQSAAPDGFALRDAERQRLRQQQQALQRSFADERAQCLRRFLVFDCQREVDRRRRAADAQLRDRLRQLDLLDREQRAQMELRQVHERQAEHVAPASAASQPARNAQPAPAAAPARTPAAARAAVPAREPAGAAAPLQSASQAQRARERQQQRVQAYEQLRERVSQQPASTVAPLPVPPASGPLLPPLLPP